MRKQKTIQGLLIISLLVLLVLLNIPKFNQISPLVSEALLQGGFENINFNPTLFFSITLVIEVVVILINVAILNWVYKMSELNYALSTNLILYLTSTCVSKALSLVIPVSVLSSLPFISNLIFGICFLILHYYTNDKTTPKQKLWLIGFVVINLLLSFL